MFVRTLRLPSLVLAVVFLSTSLACALWLELGETKEQLKLKYDVSLVDHGTGRVTAKLTLDDEGRLKPVFEVRLTISGTDGTGRPDLSLPLAIIREDGKQFVEVHLKRELAQRAVIQLMTSGLDGKIEPLNSYYHNIVIADYMKNREPNKD